MIGSISQVSLVSFCASLLTVGGTLGAAVLVSRSIQEARNVAKVNASPVIQPALVTEGKIQQLHLVQPSKLGVMAAKIEYTLKAGRRLRFENMNVTRNPVQSRLRASRASCEGLRLPHRNDARAKH